MLTYKETDYPVAKVISSGVRAGEFIYYSEEYKAPPPPKKIRKLLEMYDLTPEDLGGEIECEHPYEKMHHSSDQMRGSPHS